MCEHRYENIGKYNGEHGRLDEAASTAAPTHGLHRITINFTGSFTGTPTVEGEIGGVWGTIATCVANTPTVIVFEGACSSIRAKKNGTTGTPKVYASGLR